MRTFRTISAFCRGLLLSATVCLPALAQLPFDPSAIDQLTPEQRQKAVEALGSSGTGGPVASPDGRFRDQQLSTPRTVGPNATNGSMSPGGVAGAPGSGTGTIGTGAVDAPTAADLLRQRSGQTFGQGDPARRRNDLYDPSQSNAARRPKAPEPPPEYGDVADAPLQPFGYDLFTTGATTFAPATDIPVPADYVVGPGDSVRVQLFGNENGNYSLLVGRDGQINFPKLGPIAVAGQRFDDVRQLLTERVNRELIGVQSSISLGELRSVRVFLTGDVRQPGSYTVSSLATITNLLFVGGGVTEVGSLRRIQLKRNGRLVQRLDLYALLLHGDSSGDVRLSPGDVVFVPPVGERVSVAGAVKRPAIYELDDEASVDEVIELAGGLLASVNTGTAQIERFVGNKRAIQQLDLARDADLLSDVQDGDFLRVGPVASGIDDKVRIIGHVRYPGPYQWRPGYDLRSLLGTAQIKPSDARAEAYLPLGLIERTDPATGVRGWTSFNVSTTLDAASPCRAAQPR